MNEKSNPMPMMYKTIPAVAELNKVPGFDPLKFLRHKVSRKTNEEMLQLELPYQKLWFRLRHPQGLSLIHIFFTTPISQVFVSKKSRSTKIRMMASVLRKP